MYPMQFLQIFQDFLSLQLSHLVTNFLFNIMFDKVKLFAILLRRFFIELSLKKENERASVYL